VNDAVNHTKLLIDALREQVINFRDDNARLRELLGEYRDDFEKIKNMLLAFNKAEEDSPIIAAIDIWIAKLTAALKREGEL